MLSLILKIVGGLVGGIAAWYISKKIAGWVSILSREWDSYKEQRLRDELVARKKQQDAEHDAIRKKVDDFLGGNDES